MTYVDTNQYGEKIYSIEVPTSATMIIFNNNAGKQTCDMTISTTQNGYFNATSNYYYNYTPNIYCVAGDAGLCGETWNTSADPMTTTNNGIWEITFTNIARGTYKFKVAMNNSWDNSWPSSDYSLNVPYAEANVTIQFNRATEKITTKVTCTHSNTTTTDTATCGQDGTKTIQCADTACEAILSTEPSTATGKHTWDGSTCSVCNTVCEHEMHETNGVCTVCGSSVEHNYEDGICTVCGFGCNHAYSGGICSACGTVCEHGTHNTNGTCTVCGSAVSHTWENGTCSGCTLVCAHETHTTNGACSACGMAVEHTYVNGFCSGCGSERANAAQIGNQEYPSFAAALAAAEPGSTIHLLKPVTIDSLMLMDEIKVNLNGCTLTVGYVAAYPGSTITDSTGGGLLKVAKNRIMLQKNNGYLPVWDAAKEGYVFKACTALNAQVKKGDTADSLTYQFLPVIGSDTYALLAQGAASSGVTMKVVVSWDRGNGTTSSVTFTYSDSLLEEFFDSYNAEKGTFGKAFELTLSGIEGKELSFQVYFESETGVLLECPAAKN